MTVYKSPGCRSCGRVIKILKDGGVAVRAVDISKDTEAYDYVTNVLEAKSVPVVDDGNGYVIYGYQPDLLKLLVEHLTYNERNDV